MLTDEQLDRVLNLIDRKVSDCKRFNTPYNAQSRWLSDRLRCDIKVTLDNDEVYSGSLVQFDSDVVVIECDNQSKMIYKSLIKCVEAPDGD